MSANLKAFLAMIAVSEGTAAIGNHGYNALVGGGNFGDDYRAHPQRRVLLPRKGLAPLYSTAAGRYQFLSAVWVELAKRLHLPDFSPASQDAACIELIRERGALVDVEAGNIAAAIEKCRHIWASLPGAGYGQHENAQAGLLAAYKNAGGLLA
jgi:muramidase (phage lysozyme)